MQSKCQLYIFKCLPSTKDAAHVITAVFSRLQRSPSSLILGSNQNLQDQAVPTQRAIPKARRKGLEPCSSFCAHLELFAAPLRLPFRRKLQCLLWAFQLIFWHASEQYLYSASFSSRHLSSPKPNNMSQSKCGLTCNASPKFKALSQCQFSH